jgi:hypothetical protein
MKRLVFFAVLALTSIGAWGVSSCPNETELACLDTDDKVCPGSTKCVDFDATCFDEYPCDIGSGFVCESEYENVLNDYEKTVKQYNELASENVELRARRLEQKNCVLNASILEEAKNCVR